MNRPVFRFALLFALLCLARYVTAATHDDLQKLENCTFVTTEWSDGDSFQVQDAAGNQFTIRLYGVDCLEYHVNDTTDARRLRAQRRYFGISKKGSDIATSIELAKGFGQQAQAFVIGEAAFSIARAARRHLTVQRSIHRWMEQDSKRAMATSPGNGASQRIVVSRRAGSRAALQ